MNTTAIETATLKLDCAMTLLDAFLDDGEAGLSDVVEHSLDDIRRSIGELKEAVNGPKA